MKSELTKQSFRLRPRSPVPCPPSTSSVAAPWRPSPGLGRPWRVPACATSPSLRCAPLRSVPACRRPHGAGNGLLGGLAVFRLCPARAGGRRARRRLTARAGGRCERASCGRGRLRVVAVRVVVLRERVRRAVAMMTPGNEVPHATGVRAPGTILRYGLKTRWPWRATHIARHLISLTATGRSALPLPRMLEGGQDGTLGNVAQPLPRRIVPATPWCHLTRIAGWSSPAR